MGRRITGAAVVVAGLMSMPGVGIPADGLEAQVEAARADLAKAMEGVGVTDADIEVSLPMAQVLEEIAAFNAAPADKRTVRVQSTRANGKFWEDGPTWCNSYAELGNPDGFRATAVLSNFAASFPASNAVAVSAHVEVDANVDVHWHFMGRRVEIEVLGQTVGNACPPGGGFGGDIGAKGATAFDAVSHLTLVQDGGDFRYRVALVSPQSVNMTLSFGFQGIGDLGIPQTFPVPLGTAASGSLPLMVSDRGEVTLPGGQKRTYSLKLAPMRLNVDQRAATGAWIGTVEVMPPAS